MNIKHAGVFILFAFIALGFGAFALWSSSSPKAYKTIQVTKGKAVEAVYATAVVEPVTWAAIAPIKTGRITEINVDEGDIVNTGEILARLDDADLRAQIEENKALEEYYASEVTRANKLITTGAMSREKLEHRKSSLAQIRGRISMFEEQIRQLALAAPMDGTVLWRDVELGEVKPAGEILFWVGQPSPLRLEAEVDEEDIPKIKSGQSVLITADAFPGEVMEGLIHWISPKGDPVNKSYRAYVTLPEDTKLMIGMTVETNTIVEKKDHALLIPTEALAESNIVWLAVKNGEGYKARKTTVKTGIRGDNQIEILEGVQNEMRVLLPPFDNLSDGLDIRVK